MTDKPFLALGALVLVGSLVAGGIVATGEVATDAIAEAQAIEAAAIEAAQIAEAARIAAAERADVVRGGDFIAVPVEDIAEEERASTCPGGYVGGVCFAVRGDEVAQAIVTAPAARERLFACPATEDRGVWLAYYGPQERPCDGGKLIGTPMVRVACGVETDLVVALREACGEWVSPLSWKCCPACKLWENGCPPTAELCKFGNAWVDEPIEAEVTP